MYPIANFFYLNKLFSIENVKEVKNRMFNTLIVVFPDVNPALCREVSILKPASRLSSKAQNNIEVVKFAFGYITLKAATMMKAIGK